MIQEFNYRKKMLRMIRFENVSKTFGDQTVALDEISFEVPRGQFCVLLGHSGAGKSTLLSVVSRARPKIADYPFTTLDPHLGIVKYEEFKSFTMADIPGLIEGAGDGKGLGHKFLKHIERNRLLLFMIESSDINPGKTFKTLKNELITFNKSLSLKPIMLVRTKNDIENNVDESIWKKIPEYLTDISSVTNSGLKVLIEAVVKKLSKL